MKRYGEKATREALKGGAIIRAFDWYTLNAGYKVTKDGEIIGFITCDLFSKLLRDGSIVKAGWYYDYTDYAEPVRITWNNEPTEEETPETTEEAETPAPEEPANVDETTATDAPKTETPEATPAALPIGAQTFPRLYRLILKHYRNEEKKYICFVKYGYMPDWSKEHRTNPDAGIIKYLTPARLKRYKEGKTTRAEAIKQATARALREVDEYRREKIEKLNASALTEAPETISIFITWTRSRVWGYNPLSEVHTPHNETTTGTASGCGYDKTSTATAEALNKSPAILRALYEVAEKHAKRGAGLRESGAIWRDVLGYGSGYSVLPYFEGGCGQSCIVNILQICGYSLISESHGDAVTVYTLTRGGAKK